MNKPVYILLSDDLYYFLQQRKIERQRAGLPFSLVAQVSELIEAERKREVEAACSSEH